MVKKKLSKLGYWVCVAMAAALLSAVGHAETPAPMSAARRAKLAELTGQLRIGAEFFLNRTDTKASVEKQFASMHATGLTLARIFVIWDDVERVPGVWDFSHYDWIYDAAEKNGIQIAATLCPEDPPGWAGKTPFYHSRVNLNDPANRAAAAVYLKKVVGRYKSHPAQGVWLLMNEPAKYDTEPTTFHAFGDWLQAKYGTVGNLNRVWFRPLKQFSDVTITPEQLENYWTDYNAVIDWRNFNVNNLIDQLLWVKQQVLAIDPNHPVHFNVTRPIGDAAGQDAWKEKKVQDIVGVSMHWTMQPNSPESDYGELYAYRLDLVAGASMARPHKPLWVTELQSGPVAFTGRFAFTETPGDLTRWMWDSYGAGSRAVIFWLWSPRNIGTEAGEWGLVSVDGTPSVRVPTVKAIADTLKHNPWLNAAHPQPAKVAILYNREAEILISLDGRGQHREGEVQESLLGCYLALHRAHIPTDFVDLDQLKRGELQKYDVLYIPYSYALDDPAIAALKTYVSHGGTLWADGLTGWKYETGKIRPTIPGGLTDLFGVEASDLYPVQPDHPYSVTAQKEEGGELWKLPLELKGAEVVLRTKDGQPFAVKHAFGKGQVFYFESAVSLAYAMRFNPVVQQWIVGPSVAAARDEEVSLDQGSREIMFRGMVQPDGLAAVLSNWGETQTVAVSFRGSYTVVDTITGESVPVTEENGRTLATVHLPAGAVAVLKATKSK
ncbi:MAG: beta-galactosidase [Acidobacteriaceae bacterium]